MARPEKFTPDDVIAAAIDCDGVVQQIADRLDTNRSTVYRYQREYPEVLVAINKAKAGLVDVAENRMVAILSDVTHPDHFRAVSMTLRTQGRRFGWSERVEIAGAADAPLVVRWLTPTIQDEDTSNDNDV
jgi:hypothetical protein